MGPPLIYLVPFCELEKGSLSHGTLFWSADYLNTIIWLEQDTLVPSVENCPEKYTKHQELRCGWCPLKCSVFVQCTTCSTACWTCFDPYLPFGNSHPAQNDLFNVHLGHSSETKRLGLCVMLPAVWFFQESMIQEIIQYSLTELVWIWILIQWGLSVLGCPVPGYWKRSVLFCSRVLFVCSLTSVVSDSLQSHKL